ncbi:hypothetical protein L226DRAFT_43817 [Lentinus tigrinus ALCF2SS1-7]|uniref:uncharacterized protein n=1 Tax=Lentinus tigrinus ALCF2SS1-7 TaxID=1328758 RepID=UPI001166087D|nr:hypothetical protein L226DRAFT_43817 [Lentinus tigrinus ALCF2SS1-7]
MRACVRSFSILKRNRIDAMRMSDGLTALLQNSGTRHAHPRPSFRPSSKFQQQISPAPRPRLPLALASAFSQIQLQLQFRFSRPGIPAYRIPNLRPAQVLAALAPATSTPRSAAGTARDVCNQCRAHRCPTSSVQQRPVNSVPRAHVLPTVHEARADSQRFQIKITRFHRTFKPGILCSYVHRTHVRALFNEGGGQ